MLRSAQSIAGSSHQGPAGRTLKLFSAADFQDANMKLAEIVDLISEREGVSRPHVCAERKTRRVIVARGRRVSRSQLKWDAWQVCVMGGGVAVESLEGFARCVAQMRFLRLNDDSFKCAP